MTQSTYTFVASDGQTYGPNAHDVIQGWIHEGRIARDTQMARSDIEGWFKAGDYQEFTWPAGAAAAPQPAAAPVMAEPMPAQRGGGRTLADMDPGLVGEMRNHANWFYWIAGISLLFALFDGAAGLLIIGPFAAFTAMIGYFAGRAHIWAFIVGLLLLAALLVEAVFDQMWIRVAIRAWAIFEVFKGMMIAFTLRKRMRGE